MKTAQRKSVKVHEFASTDFLQPREHILCAVIIGPDRDDSTRKTLHFRSHAAAIEILKARPIETRRMIVEHQERLLSEFRKMLEVA